MMLGRLPYAQLAVPCICDRKLTEPKYMPLAEVNLRTITDEHLFIQVEDIDFYIDLTAERILAAEKIAVEIKSFLGASDVTEFHLALGQCLNYRSALRLTEPNRILYLAIPVDVYNEFFSRKFIQRIIGEYQLKLLVFNPEQEEIVIWRN